MSVLGHPLVADVTSLAFHGVAARDGDDGTTLLEQIINCCQ
jgi:hypothetical protein